MAKIIKFENEKKNFGDYVNELTALCEKDLASINTIIIDKLDKIGVDKVSELLLKNQYSKKFTQKISMIFIFFLFKKPKINTPKRYTQINYNQ